MEVRSIKELQSAMTQGVDVVLLDNFTTEQIRSALSAVDRAKSRPVIEVSGGIRLENIADYAMDGVDVLSVGSLTHSVRAVDLSLLVD